ncbi:MAG: 3-oxoacyl-ACP synthase, partial [Clostridiales bacterium]|nr:3-oxoacyl-ACP synthase [Clostridiales bacterium]
MTIQIAGTGSALPERVLTNANLENMVETTDEWIRERTGIEQRHISDQDTVASLAAKAAKEALAASGKTPADV